ncbi:MAG TPA: glycosyltransferase family 2 protein [Candidatus Udaeobacter sp.]|nr:glycosyltransferase family 2 protein [Candidatus Udaeobacter sp.]
MTLSVVLLAFNSEATLGATLASARLVSDDIHVVDSGSADKTLEIAAAAGARIVQHPFENYGRQRNWAIDNLPLKYGWQLHLDADERLTPELAQRINALAAGFPAGTDGYFIPRLTYFLGRPIRHGGMYPIWHMRLFRNGKGRCEDRKYDQHFRCDGPTTEIDAAMIDDVRMSLSEWTARHNRWADAEADELLNPSETGVIAGRLAGDPVQRKRALRGGYNRAPLFLRAFGLFFYRYVLRLGFLDGMPGLIFFVLQTFWFRFLVDAKIYERQMISPRLRDRR